MAFSIGNCLLVNPHFKARVLCTPLFLAIVGSASAIPADVGDLTFELPAPDNFHRIDGLCPAYDEFQRSANCPTLKMLGEFGPAADLYEIRTEGWPTAERVFWAQVGTDLQHDRVDPERFGEIADGFEEEHGRKQEPLVADTGRMEQAVNRHLSAMAGAPVRIEVKETRKLGSYDRGGNYVCCAVLVYARTIMPDGSAVEMDPMYVATSMTLMIQ